MDCPFSIWTTLQNTAEGDLPQELNLPAVGQKWTLVYVPDHRPQALTQRQPSMRFDESDGESRIRIFHRPDAPPTLAQVSALLEEYLRERARYHFHGLVREVADSTGLPLPDKIRIGMQRSRWGSLSTRRVLSLSARLLFLPPGLVRHIVIHELCHFEQMNHKPAFHRCVARYDPAAEANRAALRNAVKMLPDWCRM